MTASVHAALAALVSSMEDGGIRAGADSGEPNTGYRELFAAAGTEVGVWTSTPGGREIKDRPDTEVVSVLSGLATITDESGISFQAGPGDVFVLPAGWSGRWDIIETLEKLYVTIEEEKI
ncbi:MAG: cupin domain-containing protein [Acidimicrobiia bacterium]